MILPITALGHPILREKCIPAENNPETQIFINNMFDTLKQITTGVGLAAPQVNSNLSIFLARIGNEIQPIINPTIYKRRGQQESEEGCLSIPGIFDIVPKRDEIINVSFYDKNFNNKKLRLSGFDAIVFQHEYDHINGILFIDHMTKEGREAIREKLAEIESGKIQTIYPMIFKPAEIKA